jgi:hypothetical protein
MILDWMADNVLQQHGQSVNAGFCSEVDKHCVLLGCYAASGGNFLPTFRDNLSVPSSGLNPDDGTDRLSRNIGKKLTLLVS